MKKILTILFILFFGLAKGQVYQTMPQFGYQFKRIKVDSTLHIPSFCGVPTLRNSAEKEGAIAIDTCNNTLYKYTRSNGWSAVGGGGASTQDLASVLNVGNKGYKNIELYTTDGSDNVATISPIDNDGRPLLILIDSTNKTIQLTTNSKTENPAIYFGVNNIFQTLEYLPNNEGIVFMPIQSDEVDTLATLRDIRTNVIDTTNKWVNSVTKINDSTIRVVKGIATNDISFTTSTNAKRLITNVWNNTGATITRGSVVYINGAHSSLLPTIALAKANAEATSAYTYGLVVDDIADNSEGVVIQNGAITNLNLPTSTYTDGQTLYLSPTTAGGYTLTKPLAPNHYVAIGTITRAHPVFGTIQVAIRNGFQLDEMSDVSIAPVPLDSTILQFRRTDSLWHDISITNAIGTKYIKPSDTATMLTNYAKTSSVNLKVNISDTATMLTNYAKTSAVNLKVNISDTSSMLTNYAKTSIVNTKLNTSDSSIYFSKYRSDTMRTNIYSALNGKQSTLTNPVTGTGTSGSLTKFNGTSSVTNATADVDYLQQDMSMVAFQAMGSSIKGYTIDCPSPHLITNVSATTSQTVYFVACYIPKSVTITGVRFYVGNQQTGTGTNYNGVGLYSQSGGTLTLVASSTNDATLFQQGNNAWYSKAFSSTYSASAGLYYIAIVNSTSATAVQLGIAANTATNTNLKSFDFTNNNRISATLAAQTSLPSSQALSGTTLNVGNYGLYLY